MCVCVGGGVSGGLHAHLAPAPSALLGLNHSLPHTHRPGFSVNSVNLALCVIGKVSYTRNITSVSGGGKVMRFGILWMLACVKL